MNQQLKDLADPNQLHGSIDVSTSDKGQLVEQLRLMLLIRKAEEQIADMVVAGMIKCPCHLAIGQEAIAVGLATHLRTTDRSFGAHRSHGHFLALNQDIYGLFAEVLGREDGCSKGMGGSMHLIDQGSGFLGSVPIVGATVPIAVGAALAAKMDGRGDVAVSYFGDGAIEEGGVQESLNMAASMQVPVIFVCENNLYSSHLHISLRQPSDSTARFAEAHNIPVESIDGNDVVQCTEVACLAIERARAGKGPFFIEAVTYRWRGHVGPSEDTDVGVKRKEDLALWKRRDPISRLVVGLEKNGILSKAAYEGMQVEVDKVVKAAWQRAEQSPFPDQSKLLDLVYSGSEAV